jgi:uncharacterized membrane protein
MKKRLFIMTLVLLTIGVTLWSSVAQVMAGDAASSGSKTATTSSKATSSASDKSSGTDGKSAKPAGKGGKSVGKALDNGPKVAPKEAIQPIETIQRREPIAPRG